MGTSSVYDIKAKCHARDTKCLAHSCARANRFFPFFFFFEHFLFALTDFDTFSERWLNINSFQERVTFSFSFLVSKKEVCFPLVSTDFETRGIRFEERRIGEEKLKDASVITVKMIVADLEGTVRRENPSSPFRFLLSRFHEASTSSPTPVPCTSVPSSLNSRCYSLFERWILLPPNLLNVNEKKLARICIGTKWTVGRGIVISVFKYHSRYDSRSASNQYETRHF